jgi:hypothetical protein
MSPKWLRYDATMNGAHEVFNQWTQPNTVHQEKQVYGDNWNNYRCQIASRMVDKLVW